MADTISSTLSSCQEQIYLVKTLTVEQGLGSLNTSGKEYGKEIEWEWEREEHERKL